MAFVNKIKEEKLEYNINREAPKISALLSRKTDKYEYLTGKVIFNPDQTRIIEEAKFTCSPLVKVFGKQIKSV